MTDLPQATAEERIAYVADLLIDLAILLRGGRPASTDDEPKADQDAN